MFCNGAGSQPTVVADSTPSPGAVVKADLNNDGITDAIVANSGGNDVIVFPGLPGGGFSSQGQAYFTGTDPGLPCICRQIMTVRSDGKPESHHRYESDSHPQFRLTPLDFFGSPHGLGVNGRLMVTPPAQR